MYGSAATINSTTLVYDAFGRMVEQQNGSVYSQRLYSPMGKTAIMNGQTLTKAFVALPGGETAIYNTSGLAYYRHADWLGSSRLTSTASRTVYSDSAYAPFGEQYAVTGTVDASFTGQNSDTVTSLYDFTFREHSPSQGRWISPDPAGLAAVNPMNPQSWNRYAYVLNNPMSLIDPFGDDCYDSNGNATSAGSEAECFGGGGGASWWDPTTGTWWVPTTSTVSSVQGNNIETTSLQAQETLTAANNGNWQSAGMGFAGFNMQKIVAFKYSECTGAFHQTTVGKVAQVGSLTALTPLNSNYGANWFETLSFGSLKAAFVGGIKGGSAMVGEAVESAIGVVASPFLLTATGVDTGASAACAGGAVLASVPPGS